MAMNIKACLSSKNDQWTTPQDFFDKLNDEFHFDLDPCADEYNHKCEEYFTREQDGLMQDWGGHTVFCNPPYGREIGKWVKKSWEESKKNTTVVMLIPARTDTAYFHDYIYGKAENSFHTRTVEIRAGYTRCAFPEYGSCIQRRKR